MQLLSSLAIACCAVLLCGIAALWWKLRRMEPTPGMTTRTHALRERRQHPRLDLAAGRAPQHQMVRERHRGQGLRRQTRGSSAESPIQRRPDRAYFNPSFGDLRDPDLGQAPAGGVLRPMGSLGKRER